MNELTAALTWWLAIQGLGLAALPLAFRLFGWLPDRGYSFSKPLGVLLTSYLFWLLNSLGFIHNSAGGVLIASGIVAAVSIWAYRRDQGPEGGTDGLRSWARKQITLILVTELLFAVAFALWLAVRAHNPTITGTEKPMDLAFINAISRSDRFPPADPWLSGFAISYYYFGYVIIAALGKLAVVPGSLAFNLGLGWQFAGTLLGAFGLVFNLVAAGRQNTGRLARPLSFGIVGGVLAGVMGNLEAFLEVLHVNAILPTRFWQWLDIKEINIAPPATPSWPPRSSSWWWWRASRVIHDRDLFGNSVEVIDEFPFFSFLLGDMHPHVLTLPFIFLALALALNWWLKPWKPAGGDQTVVEWAKDFVRQADPLFLGIYTVCLGALAFLNTWDYPVYLFVTVGALGLAQFRTGRRMNRDLVGRTLVVGSGLLVAGVLAYLPFYIGFRSQAGGILPNIISPSRLSQFSIMFGPFLFLVTFWIASLAWRSRFSLRTFLGVSGGLAIALLLLALLFSASAILTPQVQGWVAQVIEESGGATAALLSIVGIRAKQSWTAFFLLAMIGAVVAIWGGQPETEGQPQTQCSDVTPFVLLLVLTAALLALAPEFVYLKDNFGTRMNTVFKFYYQVWVLLAVAAAFALHALLERPGLIRWAAGIGGSLLIAAGLFYPLLSVPTRTNHFSGEPTLDGMAYMAASQPADYAAISWLQENVSGTPVILEAVGGQYSWGGRISAHTGLPTVLGWAGHEYQWRGSTPEPAIREKEIQTIYTSPFWSETQNLLDKYRVEYVIVGPLEWSTYGQVPLVKFDRALETVFEAEGIKIYRWNSLTR